MWAMPTEKELELESLITEMSTIMAYQLWGNPKGLAKEKIDYQIMFDKKLRDLAFSYAKTLKVGKEEEQDYTALTNLKVRFFNRICSLLVINKQENPDNRICGSCLEEKPRNEFGNFDPNPKKTNVCSKCSRKVAEAVQNAIGLPR